VRRYFLYFPYVSMVLRLCFWFSIFLCHAQTWTVLSRQSGVLVLALALIFWCFFLGYLHRTCPGGEPYTLVCIVLFLAFLLLFLRTILYHGFFGLDLELFGFLLFIFYTMARTWPIFVYIFFSHHKLDWIIHHITSSSLLHSLELS